QFPFTLTARRRGSNDPICWAVQKAVFLSRGPMTRRDKAQSAYLSCGSDVKRNFILQQGLGEPAAGTCALQYSALLFQPRLVGLWIVVAAILEVPLLFFALAAVLWWSALVPRLNPFDALHNWTLARSSGITLTSAPAPPKFAQFLAGSFAIAIGLSLALGWRMAALVLEVCSSWWRSGRCCSAGSASARLCFISSVGVPTLPGVLFRGLPAPDT